MYFINEHAYNLDYSLKEQYIFNHQVVFDHEDILWNG